MFLKKLYQYNKFLFFIVLVFLLGYGYLNYKWGISATPIHQYGMYSGKAFLKDTLQLYIVKANVKIIEESAISQTERDIIQSYPDYYEKHKNSNDQVYNTVSVFFNYAGFSTEKNRYKFVNDINHSLFNKWYLQKIETIIKEPIKSIQVIKQQLSWQSDRLTAIGKPTKITFIAAE